MKPKITARIRQAKEDEGTDALWLLVDRHGPKTNVDDLREMLMGERADDEGNVAYAVLKGELKAIRDAIDDYLETK